MFKYFYHGRMLYFDWKFGIKKQRQGCVGAYRGSLHVPGSQMLDAGVGGPAASHVGSQQRREISP